MTTTMTIKNKMTKADFEGFLKKNRVFRKFFRNFKELNINDFNTFMNNFDDLLELWSAENFINHAFFWSCTSESHFFWGKIAQKFEKWVVNFK